MSRDLAHDLRSNWAVAVLMCLAEKHGGLDILELSGRAALGKAIGVSTAEINRAMASTSIKTLAQWAADNDLVVLQDGFDVVCTQRPTN